MPECEKLEFLGVNCTTMDTSQKKRKMNEQKDKICVNKDLKISPLTICGKCKVVDFIAGLLKEANMVASAKTTQEMHNDYINIFFGNWVLKGIFSFRLRKVKSHTRNCPSVWHMHSETFPEGFECLQWQKIMISLEIDETL